MWLVSPLSKLCYSFALFKYLEPPAVVAQTLTSNPTGNVFCNGSEVIFTCETRGSDTLVWTSDGFYVQENITFGAQVDGVNRTIRHSSSSTVATLTQNYLDGDVRVLVSTLRITPLLDAPNGFVMCAVPGGTEKRLGFHVIGVFVV